MIEVIDPQTCTPNQIDELCEFLHTHLGRFRDQKDDIHKALSYAQEPTKGGRFFFYHQGNALKGAVVVLNTQMSGFVPENFLVYIAVDEKLRGLGIGAKLMQKVQDTVEGRICLHVEHDNPAGRLYERVGFTSKYKEMRWEPHGNA